MTTIMRSAAMSPDDVADAINLATSHRYHARRIGERSDPDVLVLFETFTIGADMDAEVLQEQFRQRVTTMLTEHGIPH